MKFGGVGIRGPALCMFQAWRSGRISRQEKYLDLQVLARRAQQSDLRRRPLSTPNY